MRVIIAYATRYGATKSTAEEIAAALRDSGLEAMAVDAKRAKAHIESADAVVIGSSIAAGMWKGAAKRAMARASRLGKPYAVFVSAAGMLSGKAPGAAPDAAPDVPLAARVADAVRRYVDTRIAKLPTAPLLKTAFGGRMEFGGKVAIDNRSPEDSRAWAAELAEAFTDK